MPEFKASNDKEYELEIIWDSVVYTKEVDRHLLRLYNLVAWKSYSEKKNIWELFLVVMHLQKMVSLFYKDYLEKLTVTLVFLDSALSIAKPTVKFFTKWKQKCLAKKHLKICQIRQQV